MSAGLTYCHSQLNLSSLLSIHGSVHLRSLALLLTIALLKLIFQNLRIFVVLSIITQLYLQMSMRLFKKNQFQILGSVFSWSCMQVLLLKVCSEQSHVCMLPGIGLK